MVIFHQYMDGDLSHTFRKYGRGLPSFFVKLVFEQCLVIVSAWDRRHVLFAALCAASLGTPRGCLTRTSDGYSLCLRTCDSRLAGCALCAAGRALRSVDVLLTARRGLGRPLVVPGTQSDRRLQRRGWLEAARLSHQEVHTHIEQKSMQGTAAKSCFSDNC
jgi:hypothetical protein